MIRQATIVGVVLLIIGLAGFWLFERPFEWAIDPALPLPEVPADNPMSDVKVELGQLLFYDERLSVNSTMSCATCHIQALAFTDGKARSIGATGQVHPRSAMTLVNVAYASRLTWANQLLDKLEDQALTPLFGDNPIEMGMAGRESAIADLLRSDERYKALLPRAFPQDQDPYSILNAVRSIAAFTRTIVSNNSAYDRFLAGDEAALNEECQTRYGTVLLGAPRVLPLPWRIQFHGQHDPCECQNRSHWFSQHWLVQHRRRGRLPR